MTDRIIIDWTEKDVLPNEPIFCEICCYEDIMPEDQTICPKGHTFCKICAAMMAQRQITNFQASLPCMSMEGCEEEFQEEEVKGFLNEVLYKRWKELQIEKYAKELGIEEPLDFCPFCDFYRVIIEPNDSQIFICGFEDCQARSCRKCKAEDHSPLTCKGEYLYKLIRIATNTVFSKFHRGRNDINRPRRAKSKIRF